MNLNKTILTFCLLVTFLITKNIFPQGTTADQPDLKTKSNSKHISKENEPGLDNSPVFNNPTDEFGSFSLNGYLGSLNASANYVTIPTSTDYDGNISFDGTIEMWIYAAGYANTPILITKGTTSTSQFLIGIQTSGLLFFRIAGSVATNTGGTVIPLNQWTHIAVTWTGGSPYTVTFYVNGAASGPTQNLGSTWTANTDPVIIGGSTVVFTGEFFNGNIDEVRIWEPLLTAARIQNSRFVGLGDGGGANTAGALTSSSVYAGLISSWTFNTNGTAYDDISGHNGTYAGAASAIGSLAGQPIPYNFALLSPGNTTTSFVKVPTNAALTPATTGTLELWTFLTVGTPQQYFISKGATGATTTYLFGVNSAGKLFLYSGGVEADATGPSLPLNKWIHIAVTWNDVGSTYNVNFYVNGVQNGTTVPLNLATIPTNTDALYICNAQAFNFPVLNGYVDEVRIWNTARANDEIKSTMFGSCRGITSTTGLVGAWNFDSNLNNFSATTGINGSFNTGGTNNMRLSAYLNESNTGAPGVGFTAHATVVNRNAVSNPFPGGFSIRATNQPIPDVNTITDNIVMGGSGSVTSVEVFVSLQHTYASDLTIKLKAPNNTEKILDGGNGSSNKSGILTFFVDGNTLTSNAAFFAPWSNTAGPDAAMGTFGGSPVNGTWTLTITDGVSGDSGTLLGWGIRLNGTLTGIEPVTGITPNKFQLYQNYPNPFNPSTNIKFDIPKDGIVKIKIYDIMGREVSSVMDEFKKAGEYEVSYNAAELASGTYFYKIESGDFRDVKKMILIK